MIYLIALTLWTLLIWYISRKESKTELISEREKNYHLNMRIKELNTNIIMQKVINDRK